MIYYGIAAIAPLCGWCFYDFWVKHDSLADKQKQKFKKWATVLSVLPMFLLFVLRYQYVGADTIGYVRFFNDEIRRYSFSELLNEDLMRFEIGFRLYTKIISLFTEDYTMFFFVNGVVIFGTLLRFSFRYTKNPFVFFFLFISLGTYSFFETGLRQALAIIACLWAVDFLQTRKIIPFLLCVIVAYYFHKSALIFAMVYPLCTIKKYDWMIALYILLMVIFVVGFSFFQGTINRWLGYEYDVEKTGNGGIFMLLVLAFAAYSTFMTYNQPHVKKAGAWVSHLSFISALFWVLRLISRTAERISFYYIFGLYIYFSWAVDCKNDKLSAFMKWILIAISLLLFIYRNTGVTYRFYWEG